MITTENVIETGIVIVTVTATETVTRETTVKTDTGAAGTGVGTTSGWITWTGSPLQSLSLPLSRPRPRLQPLPPSWLKKWYAPRLPNLSPRRSHAS